MPGATERKLGRPHVAAIRTFPDVRNASDSRPGSYGCSLRQGVSAGCGAMQLRSLGASCLEMPRPTTFVDSSDRWRSPIVWMVRSLEPATPAGGLYARVRRGADGEEQVGNEVDSGDLRTSERRVRQLGRSFQTLRAPRLELALTASRDAALGWFVPCRQVDRCLEILNPTLSDVRCAGGFELVSHSVWCADTRVSRCGCRDPCDEASIVQTCPSHCSSAPPRSRG